VDVLQPDELKGILTNNPEVVIRLKQSLFDAISAYYGDLADINLMFTPEGFGIVLKMISLMEIVPHLSGLPVDNYVEIAKNFTTISELVSFCGSNSSINAICKTSEFWGKLLTTAYPYANQRGYNPEKVYKGYLTYKYYTGKSYKDLSSTGEYIKFLIGNRLPIDDRIRILNVLIQLGLDDIFEELLSLDYSVIADLKRIFNIEFNMGNINYVINFLRMLPLNSNYDGGDFMYGTLLTGIQNGALQLSPQMWNSIYHLLIGQQYSYSNNVIEHQSPKLQAESTQLKFINGDIIPYFNASSVAQALRSNDLQFLSQILSTGEWFPIGIIGGIQRAISAGNPPSQEAISIIRQSMKPYDIETLDHALKDKIQR
jgi:hypothetical protein